MTLKSIGSGEGHKAVLSLRKSWRAMDTYQGMMALVSDTEP